MTQIVKNKYTSIFFVSFLILGVCIVCLGIWIVAPMPPPSEEESQPSWSPDGQHLAYVCYLEGPTDGSSQLGVIFAINYPRPKAAWSQYTEQAADICVIDADGRNRKRLTQEIGKDWHPIWSPDGTKITYLRPDGIYVIDVDGNNHRQLVQSYAILEDSIAWSPDGSQLLFAGCLHNPDSDAYLVNVDSSSLTNLTSNSRSHDIRPKWILNGSKIFLLSTTSSTWRSGSCDFLKGDAPLQMKIISVDGSDETAIYRKLYYPFVAASNIGQIAFVSDLTSETEQELWDSSEQPNARLYTMGVNDSNPVEIPTQGKTLAMFRPIVYSWSPYSKYLLYFDQDRKLKILNRETGEVQDLPSVQHHFPVEEYPELAEFSWSPDGQQIAATIYLTKGGDEHGGDNFTYVEKYIYIFDLQKGITYPLIQK